MSTSSEPPQGFLIECDRGNGLIAVGATLTLVGLVWGGVHYPWASAHVLGPLISGVVLMVAFFVYEISFLGNSPSEKTGDKTSTATLPLDLLNNRTSVFA